VLEPFLAELGHQTPTPHPFTVHQVFSGWFSVGARLQQVLRKGEWRTKDNFAFLSPKVFNVYAKSLNTTYATFTTKED
jgi:hypothetical protein